MMVKWATRYPAETVAEIFGSSVYHVLKVCEKSGVAVTRKPRKQKLQKLRKLRKLQKRIVWPSYSILPRPPSLPPPTCFCLACHEQLPIWQSKKCLHNRRDKYSYCAECAAELFHNKIIQYPVWTRALIRFGACPLEDTGPWYENALRAYEGD